MMRRAPLLIVAAAIAAVPVSAAQFRSGVEVVTVDVMVRRGGRPVTGLKSEHFELFDSGVPQRIRSAGMETLPLNVMLALDVSSSTEGQPLEDLKHAARAVVSSLRVEDRMALLTFTGHVELRAPWTADAARLTRGIDGTYAAGVTSLRDAIFCALSLREGVSGRTLLIVFSDGYDTASWLTARALVAAAERTDVSIHVVQTIGIPDRVDDELRRRLLAQPQLNEAHLLPVLARETGGAAMSVIDSGETRAAFLKILDDFRAGYVLTYTPEGVSKTGWHPIEVRLKDARGDVRARRGYTQP
jgi:Ca-activated chloride channel family protein